MTSIERKSRYQDQVVSLERLTGEFERIRALNRQDPFELKKGRGVHDDDSTAMTEATISIASNGSGEDSISSFLDDEHPVPLQRSQQFRPDLNCDTASYVTPQVSNKAKKNKSPSRRSTTKVDIDKESAVVLEETSRPSAAFFDEINDCLMSCFSCTSSCTPPASTFPHYNNIPAPEPQGSSLEDVDYFNPDSLARIPFANRLG